MRAKRILITGAAGRIGSLARVALVPGRQVVRLFDRDPVAQPGPLEETVIGDIADIDALAAACAGMDCLVHLAGIPTEAPWDDLLPANVIGAYNGFEAARCAGVRRVVYASSNHAVGFHSTDHDLDCNSLTRPDSLYGAAKVWGEALASLYADRHGLETCALRIGSFRERPLSQRELKTWISHRDMGQLLRCCVDAPAFHHFVAYGISANSDAQWSNGDLDAWLGYVAQDNAADWADNMQEPLAESSASSSHHGGPYCEPGFSGNPRLK